MSAWTLPDRPWVLHTARFLGALTDRWIDLQSSATDRYESALLGSDAVAGARRQRHWMVARDRPLVWLAYRGMWRSQGLTAAWFAPAFRSSKPSVIHAHYGPVAALQVGLVRALRAPLVASFYGYDATQARFIESRGWRRRYRRLFQEAGAVIVEGPAMASRIEALGCPPGKVHIVRLPADEQSLKRCHPADASHFLVTLAGRFVEQKGFDVGIRAFARGLGGREDARLVLIGGGPLEGALRQVAAEQRLDDQVIFKGRLAYESFMESVATSDVALYPSRTDRTGNSEGGAPVTLIEAQWLGVPSIVSAHDDLPFVAAPAGSIVLDPRDVDAWAEALLGLYRDRHRLARMASAAREYSRANHALIDNLRAREAIYDSVT